MMNIQALTYKAVIKVTHMNSDSSGSLWKYHVDQIRREDNFLTDKGSVACKDQLGKLTATSLTWSQEACPGEKGI